MLSAAAIRPRSGLLLATLMILATPERSDQSVRVRWGGRSLVAAPVISEALTLRPPPVEPVPVEPPASPGLPDLAAAARALELDELVELSVRVAVGDANPDWIAISTGPAIAVSRDGGRRFRRLDGDWSAELPVIWFDRRGRLLVQSEDTTWTEARGELVETTGRRPPPEPAPMLDFEDDVVRWRGQVVRGIPAGKVSLVDAPWPALHVAGGIYEVVAGVAEWRLAVPGPYENGDLINVVAIDRAGRVWLTEYIGGGDCDGSERLVLVGVIDRRVSARSGT